MENLDFFLIINSLTEEENLEPQWSVVHYREAEIWIVVLWKK